MKKVLLFAVAFITTISLQAELHFQDYGPNGWHVGLNENVVVDFDQDGIQDFYINGFNNELGFVPIWGQGCFSSLGTGTNNIGSQILTIHQPGDVMDDNMNTFLFIDDGRGSSFSANTNELADGWVHLQDTYVGVYIFTTGRFGWLKVAVDVNTKKLIIKEMAYEDTPHMPILIGDTGQTPVAEFPMQVGKVGSDVTSIETSTEELEKDIAELNIFPNPASEKVNIFMNYEGNENLNVVITNSVGKEVYRTGNAFVQGETNLEIPVSQWSNGIYFVQFQSKDGTKVERISVNR